MLVLLMWQGLIFILMVFLVMFGLGVLFNLVVLMQVVGVVGGGMLMMLMLMSISGVGVGMFGGLMDCDGVGWYVMQVCFIVIL